jgi:hypothetical protein
MRANRVCLGLCLGLALAAPARAQQQGGNFWAGFSPRPLNFKPTDSSRAMQTHDLRQVIHTSPPIPAFNLSTIFHSFTMPSWPPKIGTTQYPAFQPYVQNVPATRPLTPPARSFFSFY